ncbi:MAG: RNase adaptor protein RapZ, partial [Nitrospirae bacterium]|nr:RNase adaptor protein RapZ [Nitrospirota bacterium]
DETRDFLSRMVSLIDFLIPHYIREGRSYLVIGIGCTGGMHRSPVIVEELAKHIRQKYGLEINVTHRDM